MKKEDELHEYNERLTTIKSNIYTKLLAFQRLNISVKKDGKNPHFKSNYSTLNEVLDKVKKPLNDLGVVIIFEPQIDCLVTILYDTESGTQVSGQMKYVGTENAQKLLACNTYFRRGSLVSLLGLEDEDDDGNKASEPAKPVKQKLSDAGFNTALKRIKEGEDIVDQIKSKFELTKEQLNELNKTLA